MLILHLPPDAIFPISLVQKLLLATNLIRGSYFRNLHSLSLFASLMVTNSLAGVSTPWKPATSAEEDADNNKNPGEKLTDSAKLKGVFWPGMNLFDSATPEMKRMRNQKKDGNILEQMIATSRDTEPAEISYHANGEFRASRDIFGPLSTENSPVSWTKNS